MNRTDNQIKKPRYRFNQHRLLGAIVKGVFLGWVISILISGWYCCSQSYVVANQRLLNMMQSEQDILATYQDTKLFALVMSVTLLAKKGVSSISRSSAIEASAYQLQSESDENTSGIFAPVASKISDMWNHSKENIKHIVVIVKNNSLMTLGKLALFILGLPMILMSWILGMVDGFVIREIRRAEFGRESSFIFHRLLGLVPGLLSLVLVLYLVLPIWINPVVFFIGVSMMTWVLTSKMISKFKKYV